MATVTDHYDNHLGPVYLWMAGGMETALRHGESELASLGLDKSQGGRAVDLGAGFGMHAIPLAKRGFDVVAIDTCKELLEEIGRYDDKLPIKTVKDKLESFRSYIDDSADLILCMGDTLTHLSELDDVRKLISEVCSALKGGGVFVIALRDYSTALEGSDRFIPVRSDGQRIFTCFLEFNDSHVTVNDLLYENHSGEWKLTASSYRKVRIPIDWLDEQLTAAGFRVRRESGMSGMVRFIAEKLSFPTDAILDQ